MRILVGYDGSEGADAALIDLERAGLPDQAEALIVSVADVTALPDTSSYEFAGPVLASRRLTAGLMFAEKQRERILDVAAESARKGVARVQSYFPNWDVRAENVAGSASWELLNKAHFWRPDLVVVGSNGRSQLGRFVLGSVSKNIVTDSEHSVRVARGVNERNEHRPPRIVIGVDGSTEAEHAVRAVGRRVWPGDTEVRIIAVDDGTSPARISGVLPTAASMIAEHNEEMALASEQMVQWAENQLSLIGLEVSVAIEKGDPGRVLMHHARTWGAGSIFVGGRRFSSTWQRFRLGSVATALVTKAPCSVEVVRI